MKEQSAPYSKESEMMVLGCMITNINALNAAGDLLDSGDFYFKEHRKIFQVLKNAYKEEKPADIHLVAEELKRKGELEAIGGIAYLTGLAQYVGTSAYIEEYAKIVKDKSILRKIVLEAQEVEKVALSEPDDVLSALDDAQQRFFRIGQTASSNTGKLISEILAGPGKGQDFLKTLEERQNYFQEHGETAAAITGAPTHFVDLDKMINGLNPSNLNILAARPAMGKTALALNIAENVCFKSGIPVGVFSLEMSAEQLCHRIVASQSGVEARKIRTGSLSGQEYQNIVAAVRKMQQHTLIIDDQPGLKITDLRARARRMKEVFNIGLLVIDYLQLISGSGTLRSVESRQIEISEISRMLKTLARELHIPVICLSQLSRKVEERTDKRPTLSDLRESGSIEQDADAVMFLLRQEYYDEKKKPGMAELILAKNRHGATGTVELTFRKEIAQFANYIPEKRAASFAAASFSPDAAAFSHFSPK